MDLENDEVMVFLSELQKEKAIEIYNVATDIKVNDELRYSGIISDINNMPETFGFPKGLTVLEYAKLLREKL